MSFFGSIIGAIAAPLIGGLIGGSSARSTNQSNERIAQQETEFNQASAREANLLTEKLAGNAIKSTEGMTSSALALSKSQFDQSQAFNERMSNTAYSRGVRDLKSAGLNPILAATRGVTSTPTVSGGPAPSGSGTGGSGTAARASQFRKVNEGLQALNSATAISRLTAEVDGMRLANTARRKYGKGDQADFIETLDKAGADMIPGLVSKHFGPLFRGVKGKSPNARPTIGRHKTPTKNTRRRSTKSRTVPLKTKKPTTWSIPPSWRRAYRQWKSNPLNKRR